jgi:hypothetical protein
MGTFTMSLKEVIDLTGGTTTVVDGITKLTGGRIGLDAYPIFDETYRDILNGKIVDYFWNREIGQESVSMFQQRMRRTMNLWMPYYNQLYKSTQIEYDALSTMALHTVASSTGSENRTDTNTTTNTTDTGSTARTVQSETPQTFLSGSGDYATAATDVNGDTTVNASTDSDNTGTTNTSGSGDTTVSGYTGPAAQLVMLYRQSLINIDTMVLDRLEELFMLVWDTGDSYTERGSSYLY